MDYKLMRGKNDFPDGIHPGKLADFLNRVMHPYEDTPEDIAQGIEYALSEDPGRGGFIILATKEGVLVGAVVVLDTGMSGYVPPHLLLFIGVVPDLRGQGIGSALIDRVKKMCSGDIKLHVEPDNPALRLYERQGFANKYLEMRFAENEQSGHQS